MFIPLSFADQILPGSCEHTLNELVEKHLDLSIFEQRYCNDETGRLAYAPAVLLKIVLYGYHAISLVTIFCIYVFSIV
jgi:hypothetical protein